MPQTLNVDLLLLYLPVAVVFLGFSGLLSWVFLQVPARYFLKWMLWPALIAGTMYATILFSDSLGRPVPGTLPDTFTFMSYRVLGTGGKAAKLEVWTVVDGKSRLYVIPYSVKRQEAFEKGAQAMREGDVVTMNRRPKKHDGDPKNADDTEDDFESNLVKHGGRPPKS